MTYICRDERPI